MYSLALIIFVVSEKKACEYFHTGSTWTIEAKLHRNDHWKVLYRIFVFYADRKSKMATTAGHRLTLDPIGKCEDLPMIIPGQFGFNCPSGATWLPADC
jgi:hypothetical protein